jgi:WD40 repeat protein
VSAKDSASLEDRLVELLAEYDDALLHAASTGTGPAPELPPRLQRDLGYLHLLRQVLQPRPEGAAEPPTVGQAAGATPSPADPSGAAGDTPLSALGRFAIRRELGRGGFGIVFLADDPVLGRAVALKVPRPEVLVTAELRQRFQREARASAGLDHPHIVPVHEVGEVGSLCYIVSAYCPGISLAQWLNQQTEPVPVRDAAALLRDLAGAVQHAHAHGVVHRDLKPANILLVSGGVVSGEWSEREPVATIHHSPLTTHQPKITDFGLAKLAQEEHPGAETQSGAIVGTPQYMAPEQAAGKNREVGPAADVYALGAMLYELLTGRPPLQGETHLDTLLQVQFSEPLPPTRLRPKLPRDLETICLKCLEKEPARRYGAACELAADLDRFLAGEPIDARPAGRLERTWKWARRRPAAAALLLVSSLAALAVLILGWGYWDNVERRLATVQDLDDAQRDLKDTRDEIRTAQQDLDGLKQDRDALKNKNQGLQTELGARLKKLQEADLTLNFARRDLFALTLTRVADVCDLDPLAGLQMLEDARRCPHDLRDFTWGYFHHMCNRHVQTLPGAPAKLVALAYSPDGKTLAAAGGLAPGAEVKLWDIPSGKLRATLTGHTGLLRGITFSPDGKLLASYSIWEVAKRYDAGEVKLWDVATGAEQATIPWAKGTPDRVSFSRDGQTLIVVGEVRFNVGEVLLCDVATGKIRARREVPLYPSSQSIAVSPDAALVVAARRPAFDGVNNGGVTLWAFDDDQPRAQLAHDLAEMVTFSPDGKTLATQSRKQTMLWDVAERKELRALSGGVSWSPDGKTLLLGSEKEIKLLDAVTYQERCTLKNEGFRVVFSPDSTVLAMPVTPAGLQFWDVATGKLRETFTGVLGYPAFAPDGQTVAVHSVEPADKSKEYLKLWRVGSQGPRPLDGPKRVSELTPQGKVLDFTDYPKSVHVWDAFTGCKLGTLEAPFLGVFQKGLSPEGGYFVEWNRAAGGLIIRDVATGQVRTVEFHEPDGYTDVFAPDGRTLLVVTKRDQLRLVDLVAGKELSRAQGKGGPTGWAAFSPDGKVLAWPNHPPYTVGGKPLPPGPKLKPKEWPPKEKPLPLDPIHGEVLLVEIATGKELASLKGHPGEIHRVQFSPDGKTLAAICKDGNVLLVFLWDVASAKLRAVLPTGTSFNLVAFSPDSTLVAAPAILLPSRQPVVKLWDAATGQERTVLEGPLSQLVSLVFSPDGKTLLTLAWQDKKLRLWDTSTGQQRAVLTGPVSAPVFSADGRTMATTADGRVYLWQAD